ncbi:MAG: imidazoleglycerol-phosphate dehydratase HisB [Armatimonadota bacterium]|nr:imidazoleglycerol-phosphate dehydratase HisB [Armatimonadota bacterium]MDR5703386.1 imidazoleglycerol-phosphate dehydratase HisB [Armatimonadota bacterium]
MEPRIGRVQRKTSETQVEVELNLDGVGEYQVHTGIPFFDHMLAQIAVHGRFDLRLHASGDLEVDAHHTVEDVGICLGQAFRQALGEGRGIVRFAWALAPMDETLVLAAVDLSGRPFLHYNVPVERVLLGSFPTDLCEEFFRAFVSHGGFTLHLNLQYGKNPHHILEAVFKATALSLGQATRRERGREGIPSTKGRLD